MLLKIRLLEKRKNMDPLLHKKIHLTSNRTKYRIMIVSVLLIFLGLYLFYKTILYQPPRRMVSFSDEYSCRICYLLNLDGMKGLGHSALLLIDEDGNGQIFSYNGMQYNLFQCLIGNEGIGKMKEFDMDALETENFLKTGSPSMSEDEKINFEECIDFDRILYRYISREQYNLIRQSITPYIDAGDQYETLYARLHGAEPLSALEKNMIDEELRFLREDPQTPKYQIYNHNCDTAARELIAIVDEDMLLYNKFSARLTPSGNYKSMCRMFSENWGYGALGTDTLLEKLLQ